MYGNIHTCTTPGAGLKHVYELVSKGTNQSSSQAYNCCDIQHMYSKYNFCSTSQINMSWVGAALCSVISRCHYTTFVDTAESHYENYSISSQSIPNGLSSSAPCDWLVEVGGPVVCGSALTITACL